MTGCECNDHESEVMNALEKLFVSRLNRFQDLSDDMNRIILQPVLLTMAQYRQPFVIGVSMVITPTIKRIIIAQFGHKVIPNMPASTRQCQ